MDEMTYVTLMPGVQLTYLQTKQFKTNYVSLNLMRPLRKEEAPFGALLPSVLLRGTEAYPNMQKLCAHLDHLYGAGIDALSRKKGEIQILGLYMDFVDESLTPDESEILAPALSLLGQVLLHPVLIDGKLCEEYVENEKVNLINAIESQMNDKRVWATKRLVDTMFEGEAYQVSRLGESEQVRKITAASLTAYWQDLIAHSEIEIFFMGHAPISSVTEHLRKALEGLPRLQFVQYGTRIIIPHRAVKECYEIMDVTQGKLVMGLRTPDIGNTEKYPALVMCNAILGGGVTSKLFQNVREARSLCYYVSSGLEKFKGVMIISAGIDCDQYEVARDAILKELDDCKKGFISTEEMEAARRSLISSLLSAADSPGRLDDFYLGQRLLRSSIKIEQLIEQIQTVGLDEITDAADRLVMDTIYFLKGADANA